MYAVLPQICVNIHFLRETRHKYTIYLAFIRVYAYTLFDLSTFSWDLCIIY